MKTTIDLPEELVRRAKVAAAQRRSTLKNLVIEGLEAALSRETPSQIPADAMARLRKGYHLGGEPLKRDDIHAR